MNTKSLTLTALFTAAALVLQLVESALPPIFAFAPGAKMGLSNLVTLVAVFILGIPESYVVLLLRCLLGSLLSGGIFSLAYALPAGLVSLTLEIVLIRFFIGKLSIVSVSLAGAVVFNAVQLIVASLIVGVSLMPYLSVMLFASTIAGLAVGFIAYFTLKYLPSTVYLTGNKGA